MRLLSFQHTLSIIALKTWKQHSIHQFWKDSEDLDFGYIDVRGRIFRMTSNTTTQNQKFERYLPNSGPFQNFYKSNEFALVNQYRENHEQSLLFKNEIEIQDFWWNDTTSTEHISGKGIYFRSNFFGNWSVHNISSGENEKISIKFSRPEEHLLHEVWFDDTNLLVNNYNEIRGTKYLGKSTVKEILNYPLTRKKLITSMKGFKLGNIYYILFLYEDHFIQVYQFNYNYLTEEMKYMHHNEITFDKDIIDAEIAYPFLFVGTKVDLHVFIIKAFDFTPELHDTIPIAKKIPHYTKLFYFRNNLAFNENAFIPRLQFKIGSATKRFE